MKILFPQEVFYPSHAGGPANSIYWLARYFKKSGIEPIIVASDKGLPPGVATDEWSDTPAGRVIYVRTRNLRVPLHQTLIALKTLRWADVVQVSSLFYPAGTAAAIVAAMLGKSLILSPRGELDPVTLVYSKWRKKVFLAMIRTLVGTRALYHSTSDEETGLIKSVFGDDVRVVQIPNFIDLPEIADCSPGRYLLYLGRLDRKKAIDNLIAGLRNSPAFMSSDLILKIAGRGIPKYEEYLRDVVREQEIEGKVEFIGQVHGDEKERLLAGAYFTLMPSHNENFGNVVLESLAQGTPVLASRFTPWKSLEENKIGYWVGNTPAELTAAVEEMLSLSADDYNAMRGRCRPFVEANFDVARNYQRWIEVYRDL